MKNTQYVSAYLFSLWVLFLNTFSFDVCKRVREIEVLKITFLCLRRRREQQKKKKKKEPMKKARAPHSSTLAWKIPWTEKPGRLQSMGSQRVGHDWVTSVSLLTFMHWRRKWQPTPVFLPGESQGQRSLVGCCLWGHTELDTTEAT